MEGRRQVVALAGDGHVVFLHRLEQRRLGARAGAVDLVGHQQLGEDRAGDEAEIAGAVGGLVHHLRADDVGGHEVGGELDAPRRQAENGAQRLDQLGLGEAGHADQEAVAAGEDRDQRAVDHRFLAVDDLADRVARLPDARHGGVGFGNDAVGVGAGGLGDGAHGLLEPVVEPVCICRGRCRVQGRRAVLTRDCCMRHASAIGICRCRSAAGKISSGGQHRGKARQKHGRCRGLRRL